MYGVMCLKPYNAESQGHLKRVQNIILQLEIPDSATATRLCLQMKTLDWLGYNLEILSTIQDGHANTGHCDYNSSSRLCLQFKLELTTIQDTTCTIQAGDCA